MRKELSKEKIKNNAINIGSGRGEKLTNVARLIRNELGNKSKIIIKPSRTGEVIGYIADISKAEKLLDYNPQYFIEKGIKLTINWYRKH